MPRPIRIVLVGLCYVAFGGFGAILAAFVLPLALLGVREPAARIAAAQALLHRWSRRYFRFMRALGIVRPTYPPCPELLADGGGVVVVANHPSLLDVVFIMAALPRITYVAKQAWMGAPIIGRMLRACGHIAAPVGKDPADGAIALERMIAALVDNRALLVFPEGTRSPRLGMHEFRRGAFEAAARAGVPILPCAIRVDPPMLRKHQPWYDVAERPIDFAMQVLPTIEPSELGDGSRVMAKRVHDAIAAAVGVLPERPEPATAASPP
jgi:1-acyl-sn-glycerol-3-phosphate acyltransferase